MKANRRTCLTATATFVAGLLWLGSGAANAAQLATPGAAETPMPGSGE
jgi:hypothetical protein